MSPKPIRARDARTIAIEIDHREVSCPEGVSVLRAAELNDVYIPSLCSHKDLSPFGGCRLCMVEIEGMRGYPLACSTIVQEGMKVLTETAALRDMRREILELILSEHPSSCLICGEREECLLNAATVRKSGVATGCRYCPNDGQCELQTVVEKLGVTDIHYPVYYRGYEPEHDDPFFDRDYNICILCGRCVRICQEVRGTAVLAFMHRGPKTRIGPAFGRNHVEAGCEFCGACVSVCPTGALADKASKWDGKPDGTLVSTCPFCAIGCQIELRHKNGQLSRVDPNLDPEINDGQLCVRGRFCLPETTHHHERARKPVLKRGKYFRDVSWSEALDEVGARLKAVKPEEFLMVVSPDLTNESLYAAQKFVRSVMKSNHIDSTARWALPGGVGLWARLFSLPVSVRDIGHADAIIAVGLDSRFSFSVAGVEIRRALREGATLVTIDPRDSNLARYTGHWLRPAPGKEGAVLRLLADALPAARAGEGGATGGVQAGGTQTSGAKAGSAKAGGAPGVSKAAAEAAGVDKEAVDRAIQALAPGQDLAVVVGPAAFAVDSNQELAEALLRLAERERTTFLPLCQGANTRGALELGVFGELLPGLAPAGGGVLSLEDLLRGRAKPKVLYLVGEAPFFDRPDCEYVIAQDIYRPPFEVDAFLPAASFAEAEGTLTNIEGRVQELVRVESPPDGAIAGFVRPDWVILSELAEKLTGDRLLPHDSHGVLREISETVAGFPLTPDRAPRRLHPAAATPGHEAAGKAATGRRAPGAAGHRLVIEPGGFRHRGVDMSLVVEGLSELGLEEGFRLHPDDLEALGIQAGDPVTLSLDGITVSAPARVDADAAPGTVTLYRPLACGGLSHRRDLEPLYRLGGGPFPVTMSGNGTPRPAAAQDPARRADNSEG